MGLPGSQRWRPRLLGVACGALVLGGLLPAAAAPEAPSTADAPAAVPVPASHAWIDLFVSTKDGSSVEALHPDELRIRWDRRTLEPLQIVAGATRSAHDTTTAVLLIDRTQIRPEGERTALLRLRDLVAEQGLGATRLAVLSFDGVLQLLQPPTSDRTAVVRALERLADAGTSASAGRRDDRAMTEEILTRSTIRAGRFAVNDREAVVGQLRQYSLRLRERLLLSLGTIARVSAALGTLPGRKALIYVSDGLPLRPAEELYATVDERFAAAVRRPTRNALVPDLGGILARDSDDPRARFGDLSLLADQATTAQRLSLEPQLDDVARAAGSGRVACFPIATGALAVARAGIVAPETQPRWSTGKYLPDRERNLRAGLEELAATTGGRVAWSFHDLPALVRDVAGSGNGYFSVLVELPGEPGRARAGDLAVRVSRRGTTVLARRSLGLPEAGSAVARGTLAAVLLGEPRNGLGIDVGVAEIGRGSDGGYVVTTTVRLPVHRLQFEPGGERHVTDVAIAVVAVNERGELLALGEQPLSLSLAPEDLLASRTREFPARLSLLLPQGSYRIGVGVVETGSGRASYQFRPLLVGGAQRL